MLRVFAGDSGRLTTTESLLWEIMNTLIGTRYFASVSAAIASGNAAKKMLKDMPKPILKPGTKPPPPEDKIRLENELPSLGGIKRKSK